MLVLSRKESERLILSDGVTTIAIMVVRIGPNTVRLGIEAPRGMNIAREELLGSADHERQPPTGDVL